MARTRASGHGGLGQPWRTRTSGHRRAGPGGAQRCRRAGGACQSTVLGGGAGAAVRDGRGPAAVCAAGAALGGGEEDPAGKNNILSTCASNPPRRISASPRGSQRRPLRPPHPYPGKGKAREHGRHHWPRRPWRSSAQARM